MRGSSRGTLRMGKGMSCTLIHRTIMGISRQGTRKVKECLSGTMERCIGESGLKGRSMALGHGRESRGRSSHTSGNGTMANPMDSVFSPMPSEMSMKGNSNCQ